MLSNANAALVPNNVNASNSNDNLSMMQNEMENTDIFEKILGNQVLLYLAAKFHKTYVQVGSLYTIYIHK